MNVEFVLSPVDHEEPDHRLVFEMPGVPQTGDFVTISRPDQAGSSKFVVCRTCWALDSGEVGATHHVGEHVIGRTSLVTVECEFVAGPFSSEEHKAIAATSPA